MSFALTTEQMRRREKTVTRRLGWRFLKPGDRLRAVVKAQGLKKGETVQTLGFLRVVDVRREPLRRLIDDLDYGIAEVQREGFGAHSAIYGSPLAFVEFFCSQHHHHVTPDTEVTRIELEHLVLVPA